jgi:hypothetical protein
MKAFTDLIWRGKVDARHVDKINVLKLDEANCGSRFVTCNPAVDGVVVAGLLRF